MRGNTGTSAWYQRYVPSSQTYVTIEITNTSLPHRGDIASGARCAARTSTNEPCKDKVRQALLAWQSGPYGQTALKRDSPRARADAGMKLVLSRYLSVFREAAIHTPSETAMQRAAFFPTSAPLITFLKKSLQAHISGTLLNNLSSD